MQYVVKPSTFGIGYSVYRVTIVNGKREVKYLADVRTMKEVEALCPDADLTCPVEEDEMIPDTIDELICNFK